MEYLYSITTDTLNGTFDGDNLKAQIEGSSITKALDVISTSGDQISVLFKASLSEGEEATLNGLVAAHTGEPIHANQEVAVTNSIIISETPPFATPTFRTKRDSTPTILEIAPDSTEVIDYFLTEERYVQGGELVYVNAEIGDYISAEVYDTNSVIPEAYRAALCEDWPTVAKYIFKHWINPEKAGQVIDTYPLNAKITAGLALRITYTATNTGSNRKVGLNYFLTKKL